jgi:hypothetical protein
MQYLVEIIQSVKREWIFRDVKLIQMRVWHATWLSAHVLTVTFVCTGNGLHDRKHGVQSYVRDKLEIDWSIEMTVMPTVYE